MEHVDLPMSLVEKVLISKEMEYHLDNKISLSENIFRIYSEKYFDLMAARLKRKYFLSRRLKQALGYI